MTHAPPMARSETPDDLAVRRRPAQRRSQERVERVLEAARGLLDERGYEGLVLREVARRAAVPIGTVYQFFPNAAALVRHLGEMNIARIDAALQDAFSGSDVGSEAWVRRGLDVIGAAYRDAPSFIETWAGMQVNPASRALDNADTLRNAAELAAALEGAVAAPRQEREALALLLTVTGGAVERFALQLPPEQSAALRAAFADLVAIALGRVR